MSFTGIFIGLLTVVFVVICLLMVLVVLMQRSKQDGLGAAFGGDMAGSMFGAQTSNVLVKFTVWLTALYFIITIALAYLYAHQAQGVTLPQVEAAEQALQEQPVPNAAAAAQGDPIAPVVPSTPAPTTPESTAPATPEAPAKPEASATPVAPETQATLDAQAEAASD